MKKAYQDHGVAMIHSSLFHQNYTVNKFLLIYGEKRLNQLFQGLLGKKYKKLNQ